LGTTNQLYGPTYSGPKPVAASGGVPTNQTYGPTYSGPQADPMGALNQGYNDYFNTLEGIYGGLEGQTAPMKSQVESEYGLGMTDLTGQLNTGSAELASQERKVQTAQGKNLKTLNEDLMNQFRSGANFLGSRGAGDSSAAGQYSYALSKLGNKGRGNIMGQTSESMQAIADNKAKLQNIFTTESAKLGEQKRQALDKITQWLYDAQNNIKQLIASGQLQKGQQTAQLSQSILNNATQAAMQAAEQFTNTKGMLDQWVLNKSTTLDQAMSGLKATGGLVATMSSPYNLMGQPITSGQATQGYYPGANTQMSDEEKRRLGYIV
jgi:hypothetical protein